MEVRQVRLEEAELAWALRLRGLREEPRNFGATEEEDATMQPDEIRRRFGAAPMIGAFDEDGAISHSLVAPLLAPIVGMAGIYLDSRQKQRHRGHVWGVYVAPEARRRGVARRLMTTVIEVARALPAVELLQLTVATHASAARALYESLGFRIYGTEERALKIDGTYVDEHYMVLFL